MTGSDVFIPVFLALTTGDLSRQYLLTENGGFSPRLSPKPGVLARWGRHPARYSPKPPGSRHGRAHPGGEELEESTNPGLKGDPHLDESKMKKKIPNGLKNNNADTIILSQLDNIILLLSILREGRVSYFF